ncbi:MAG TPA: T9SS type A sorting domain-containing protein [Chitinophagaceae bacterium]|nr:T9SS type A sorting domain-containing protein [Chitinophagaceae bacterium]
MKKVIPILLLFFSLLFIDKVQAQGSCPQIVYSSFTITANSFNPCQKRISFDYIPTVEEKRMGLLVTNGTTTLLSECVDVTKKRIEEPSYSYTSGIFTACNTSGLTITITPYNGASCAGLACGPAAVYLAGATLPVSLTSFTANREHNKVNLQWQTDIEINSQGFAIENKYEDDWKQIAFINSQANAGNSNAKLNYQYKDNNNNKGITQYRIRMEDMSGDHHYSEVRAVKGENQVDKTSIFPVPSTDGKVTVLFGSNETRNISLTDMSGKVLQNWNGYTPNTLIISDLKQGLYLLCYTNRSGDKRSMERIIVSGQ